MSRRRPAFGVAARELPGDGGRAKNLDRGVQAEADECRRGRCRSGRDCYHGLDQVYAIVDATSQRMRR
jgi:hypothetical protein